MDGRLDGPTAHTPPKRDRPPRRAERYFMKFAKDTTYFVVSISHDHMCIAVNGKGIRYIAEPTTRNDVVGRIEFETPLVYIGRTKELQGPTFRLPNGTLVRGHENNFNLDSEYNKDKMRNRDESNAANVKPEKLQASVKALFATLQARDLKLACETARELEKLSSARLQDKVLDEVLEQVESVPEAIEGDGEEQAEELVAQAS